MSGVRGTRGDPWEGEDPGAKGEASCPLLSTPRLGRVSSMPPRPPGAWKQKAAGQVAERQRENGNTNPLKETLGDI